MWKRMSHPNILPFIGVSLSRELAIVYPWMENGNVLEYLKKTPEANPVKLVGCPDFIVFPKRISSQLEESAIGLQYLHNMSLVHGDLQPVGLTSHSTFPHAYTDPSNTSS
jgi:serine/threonine protein kinase